MDKFPENILYKKYRNEKIVNNLKEALIFFHCTLICYRVSRLLVLGFDEVFNLYKTSASIIIINFDEDD